jgi:hypothetical protein
VIALELVLPDCLKVTHESPTAARDAELIPFAACPALDV